MNSEKLMQATLNSLEEISKNLVVMASRSEFASQRDKYLAYNEQVNDIQKQLQTDLSGLEDQETFTSILDQI